MSGLDPLSASVVVPSYGRPDSVLRLLRALARQAPGTPEFEVVIALDGEDDLLSERIRANHWPYPVRVITLDHGGRARAANAGIRASEGDVIVLLDDDMEPEPSFVAAHLALHVESDRIGVVGAAPVGTAEASDLVRYVGRKFNAHLRLLAQPGHAMTFREFYSGNFSARRSVLGEVGLFDDQFRIYGNEDGELALRLLRAGVRLIYSPLAAARQHYLKDFEGLSADTQAKGITAVQLARKHPQHGSALKLATYERGSRKWLALRALLLRASAIGLPVSSWILQGVSIHARLRLPRRFLIYELVLDYFYWTGVRTAMEPGEALSGSVGIVRRANIRRTVLHHSDAPTFGGAEQSLLTLVRGLQATRWHPAVILRDDLEPIRLRRELVTSRVEPLLLPWPGTRLGAMGYITRVARLTRMMRASVVHLNQHEHRSGRHVAIAAWLARVPVVTTVHFLPAKRLQPDLGQLLMNRIVAGTIAVSPAISKRLVSELHVDPRRVRVVLNGIDLGDHRPPAVSPAFGRDRPVVLAVGRMAEQKGFADLIAAAALARRIRIVFAGDGPLRPELERHAHALGVADRVHFLGHRDDIPSLIGGADVVAVPSRIEGLPLVLLEAMSAGKPIVATDIPGIDVALEDGISGLLVAPGDISALAAAIDRVLDDSRLAVLLGVNAQRVARERFDAARMVAEVVDEYQRLTQSAPPPTASPEGGRGRGPGQ